MFTQARIKLTAWYVAIIMCVSLLFSLVIFRGSTVELRHSLDQQAVRFFPFAYDPAIYEEAKDRIIDRLVAINAGILAISAVTAYFLAGRTLAPIEAMVEEQKRFIADASHELRTPLTAMKTQTEVALRGKRISIRQARELLQSNLEEANKMQALSNYLLSLNKYTHPDGSLLKKKFELRTVADKAIATLAPLARSKHITINFIGEDAVIWGNEASVYELITLLVDNAIKYSPANKAIFVKVTKSQRKAIIRVEDQGIGIKAADLPFIFNRFYRADLSRSKEKADGYGLGLAIAKSIVEAHGGKIKAESTVGRGTIFTVIFPFSHP